MSSGATFSSSAIGVERFRRVVEPQRNRAAARRKLHSELVGEGERAIPLAEKLVRKRLVGAGGFFLGLERLRRDKKHRSLARLAFLQPRDAEIRQDAKLVGLRELVPFLLAHCEQSEPGELIFAAFQKSRGGGDLLSQRIGRSRRRGLASGFEVNHRVGAGQGLALRGGSEISKELRILVEQILYIFPGQNFDRGDGAAAVGAVEIENRTLQAFGLCGRRRDHEAADRQLQARGAVDGVLDLDNGQFAARIARDRT